MGVKRDSYEDRVWEAIDRVARPKRGWMPPRRAGDPHQVVIVGGGQAALALMLALRLDGIDDVVCLEESGVGSAGVWKRFARMKELRTPKTTCGMDLGIPQLTFESWYREYFGDGAWEGITHIPRLHWARYLEWYRETLRLPVQFASKVEEIIPMDNGLFKVTYTGRDGIEKVTGRRVVLATGIDGCGAWAVPGMVAKALPRSLYRHTSEDIDFEELAGKPVAVLGAAASAFDNAVCALEAGAASVELFCRRAELGSVNAQEWAAFTGFLKYHGTLSDEQRWRFMRRIFAMGQLPSVASYRLAMRFSNFVIRTGEDGLQFGASGGRVRISGRFGEGYYSRLIVGTGFCIDLRKRPELRQFVEDIKLWRNMDVGKGGGDDELAMGNYPYLGADFTFVSRSGRRQGWLSRLYCFNYGALISNGLSGSSITGLKHSIPKIVRSIGAQIYRENADYYFDTLVNYPKDEF